MRLRGASCARGGEPALVYSDHRAAARQHTIRRAWQRCGLALGIADLTVIEGQIRSGALAVAGEIKDGAIAYTITIRGVSAVIVFKPSLDCVCSFFPHQSWVDRMRIGKEAV